MGLSATVVLILLGLVPGGVAQDDQPVLTVGRHLEGLIADPGSRAADEQAHVFVPLAVGLSGWLTIEAFGSALPSLAAATKIWRRMFDDEEELAREGHDFIRHEWAK